jgi:Helicase HerA, central domain/TraM recognition site of TraD and TraG
LANIAWGALLVCALPFLIIGAPLYFIYKGLKIYGDNVAIRRHQGAPPPVALRLDTDKFTADVMGVFCALRTTEHYPCRSIVQELYTISDQLSRFISEPHQTELARDTLATAFEDFTATLPSAALQSLEQVRDDQHVSRFSIPLVDLLPNVGSSIEALVLPFYEHKLRKADIFGRIRRTLDSNQEEASHGKSKLIMPSDSGLPRTELIHTYLSGTPFLRLFAAQVPFELPQELRFQGHWICGTQGSGKTTLLTSMFLEDLKLVAENKASIVVMDSKGQFIESIRHLKQFAAGQPLEGKLVVLDPEEAYPLALNPFDLGASPAHTIDLLEYIFASLRDTKNTSLQSTLFRSVFMALRAIPGASFSTFRNILLNGYKDYEDEIATLHPEDRDFFFKGEFDSRPYRDTKEQLLWRLKDLTTRVPLLREMFNSPTTKVKIAPLIDGANVIIVNNTRDVLSDTGSEFFARFFLALIRAAADQRSKLRDDQKLPTYVYIDECQNVIANDENVEKIIAECRSQKIALILAHQFWTQIKNESVKSALSNCAIRFANVDEEASQLAPRLRTEPENLHLPAGSFAAFVRTRTDSAVTIQVPLPPNMPKMTRAEQQHIRQDNQTKYCNVYKPPMPAGPRVAHPNPAQAEVGSPTEWG